MTRRAPSESKALPLARALLALQLCLLMAGLAYLACDGLGSDEATRLRAALEGPRPGRGAP